MDITKEEAETKLTEWHNIAEEYAKKCVKTGKFDKYAENVNDEVRELNNFFLQEMYFDMIDSKDYDIWIVEDTNNLPHIGWRIVQMIV